jgi:hypothetical protein
MRMLDAGEPADIQKLKTYVHELFGYLGYDTIFDACEMIDGADILKALCLLKVVQQGHYDTCVINKTRLSPRPEGKTTRPTREARVQKLTIDQMRSSFQESVAIRSCTVVQRAWRQSSCDSSGFIRRVDKKEYSGIIRHKGYSISANMWRRLMTQRVHREKNWNDSWSREIHDVENRAASRLLVFCCLTRDVDHQSNVTS